MAKDILKEAIADAKAVREVALANAKAALEEAFTPKLQSMLSAKLSEDLDEDKDAEDLDEMAYGEDPEDMEETYMDEAEDDMEENLDEEIDLEEILNELELEEVDDSKDKKVDEVKDKDEKDSMEEAKDDEDMKEDLDEARPVYKAEYANDPTYKADHVNEDSEFDLDSLLEEINNLDEKKEEDEVNEIGVTKQDITKGMKDAGMEEAEDTNEVVGAGLAGMAGLIAAAGGMAKLSMAAEDPEFKNKYPKVAKMLSTLQDMGSAAGSAMRREHEEVAEELNETKKALETIKNELNEVNLLNSKLLYVNRIFKANTLDEAQKLRVVESLDKAGSTKEAKLIYETIKDTFNISQNTKRNPKRKSIKEGLGMASKAAGTSTAPKEVISESTDMVARFQKLANITINE